MVKRSPNDLWWPWPIIFLLLIWIQVGAFAEKIIIHLKNGDRLTGQILSENTNEVTLTTTLFGTVKVPVAEISKRETIAEPAPATATNTSTNAPATVSTTSTNALAKNAPVKPANLEAQPIAATPRNWEHQLQFGLSLRYSTVDQQEFLVIAKSTYAKDRFRQIFDLNFSYGETEGVPSANRLTTSEKSEYQLSKKAYVFGLAGGGYDELRKIDAQFEIGPGFGYELLNLTNHAFVWKTEGGFNYQREYRSDNTELNSYSLRIAEIFAWRVWGKLTADAKIEFFPDLQDFGDFRFRLENNWRYPLTDRMSLDLVVIDLYDTHAAADVKRNDLQIRSTLGIKF